MSWIGTQPFGNTANVINIGSTTAAPTAAITLQANGGNTLATYVGINVNRDFTFGGSASFNTGTAPLTLNGSGARTITNSQTGALTVAGTITSGGASTLAVTGAGVTVVSGKIQDGTGLPLAVTYSGTGTLTLMGANTYTGATTVTNGTLTHREPSRAASS